MRRQVKRGDSKYKKKGKTVHTSYTGSRNTSKALAVYRQPRSKFLPVIARSAKRKFVFTDTGFSVSLVALPQAAHIFRGNSLFDPDLTGVGVQPYGFDELIKTTMYNTYTVVASKCRVYFYPGADFTPTRLHCILTPTRASSVGTDESDIGMMPYGKQVVVNMQDGQKDFKVANYSSTRNMFRNIQTLDTNFQGNSSGNPTNQWYWNVFFRRDGSSTGSVYFDVKITYYAVCNRDNIPNES